LEINEAMFLYLALHCAVFWSTGWLVDVLQSDDK